MKIPIEITEHKIMRQKSKFIAHIIPIESVDELSPHLDKIKEKYNNATHIPYAYKLTKYEDGMITNNERYSDGGEPTKTAGYPLLRLIHNKKLTNILIIVVRIYGGVKLGMGGLMKAFTEVAEVALENNKIIEKELCEEIKLKTNIKDYKNLEIILKKHKIKFKHEFGSDAVRVTAFIPIDREEVLKNHIKQFLAP